MSSERKYMLCPDFVISRHDGERHYIGEADLARLYGVDPIECVISTPANERWHGDLIRLRPRFDGNYRLPVTIETIPCEPTEPASILETRQTEDGRVLVEAPSIASTFTKPLESPETASAMDCSPRQA